MSSLSNRSGPDATCLVHSVASVLATEPSLEAVTFEKEGDSFSVATMGRHKDPNLERRIAETIRRTQGASAGCGLLEGKNQCEICATPFAPFARQSISIKQDAGKTTIARVTCPTSPQFWHWRKIAWPKLGPRELEIPEDDEHAHDWKQQLLATALCGLFALGGVFLGETAWRIPLFVAAYIAGAWFAAHEVYELLQKQKLDVHFLMLAVAGGSASIGAWGEGAALLFLFSLSGALEHYAMGRTQREIRSLFKTAPKTAIEMTENGEEREVPVETLQPAMRLLIKPDTQFPVDAEVIKGKSASDESNLTGEATPVEKTVGDLVLAGTVNLSGVLQVRVLRAASESALQKIIHLIKEAQHLKAPAQRFTDKFGTPYTYGILAASLSMFLVWWLAFRLPIYDAFYRSMTLLVVASPCALVLSIPSAVLAAIARGARRGILFRGGAAVEKLAEIKAVALDKTGTLTTGDLRVETVKSFPAGREEEVARLAYSLDQFSRHPLARAIVRHGKRRGFQPQELEHLESVPGMGLRAELNGKPVFLGRREWIAENSLAKIPGQSGDDDFATSEVWLTHGDLVGRITLRDDIRPQAKQILLDLNKAGLRTMVLTGDRRASAEFLKSELGVADVRFELKPRDKVEAIHSLTKQGLPVAMVGDGVNDAPSLAAAHVGVAMGARGSDAALEQAEVVLMNDRLENFWTAYQLSRRARRIIRQNLVISLGTVAVLVSFALAGAIPLTLGVIGHEGSTVVVVINSLRLLLRSRD